MKRETLKLLKGFLAEFGMIHPPHPLGVEPKAGKSEMERLID